ncbi:hypothetical protein HR060_05315 [Catenovulum sp. SM1970]|uniref:hypothetical protein n=1 Tax=Marinifaba aquimaris TaxID=2741323 RepID=UPI001572CDCA|nr:hypothetical protein [Marinifaba aquimaris]NTS76282.1 hypothetical protein [Marinifaba aquimaris]
MKIDWNYPAPRTGLNGSFDKFIGPGATKAEQIIQYVLPVLVMVLAPSYAYFYELNWSGWQYLVCGLFAGDMVGGILTNATSSAKRWYHRAEQTKASHIKFVATHIIHLLIVAWLFVSMNWLWFAASALFLMIAALCILSVPVYLQRPVAQMMYIFALVLSFYALSIPPGMEWFLPLLYFKLLVSYLPREEPYRPD